MNLAERTPLLALGEYHGVFGRVLFFFLPTYRHTRSLPLAGKSEGTFHGLAGEQQQEEERGVENHHFLLLPPRLSQPPQLFLVAPRICFSSPTTALLPRQPPCPPRGGAPRCPALTGERHLPAAEKPGKEDRKFLPPRAGSSRLPQGLGLPSAAPGTGGGGQVEALPPSPHAPLPAPPEGKGPVFPPPTPSPQGGERAYSPPWPRRLLPANGSVSDTGGQRHRGGERRGVPRWRSSGRGGAAPAASPHPLTRPLAVTCASAAAPPPFTLPSPHLSLSPAAAATAAATFASPPQRSPPPHPPPPGRHLCGGQGGAARGAVGSGARCACADTSRPGRGGGVSRREGRGQLYGRG